MHFFGVQGPSSIRESEQYTWQGLCACVALAARLPAHVVMPQEAAEQLLHHLLPALHATQQEALQPMLSCLG